MIAIARAMPPPTASSAPTASQIRRDRGAGRCAGLFCLGAGPTPSWVTGTRWDDACGAAAAVGADAGSDPDDAGSGRAPGDEWAASNR